MPLTCTDYLRELAREYGLAAVLAGLAAIADEGASSTEDAALAADDAKDAAGVTKHVRASQCYTQIADQLEQCAALAKEHTL